jgi:hypothetical protein
MSKAELAILIEMAKGRRIRKNTETQVFKWDDDKKGPALQNRTLFSMEGVTIEHVPNDWNLYSITTWGDMLLSTAKRTM